MSTTLLQRIIGGRTDLVFDYLAAGNPATAHDPGGVPLIRWCADHGDVSAVRHLLERGEGIASLGANLDLNGAAFHGHWQLCEFLIEQGADVNHPLPDTGEVPLHAALCKSSTRYDAVLHVLLQAGANPNVATHPGVETGSFMRDCRTRGEMPLHRAAAFGSEHAIQLLLNAGARRDAKDSNGDSPLTWASWYLRSAPVLRLLCYDGFTIHPESRAGQ